MARSVAYFPDGTIHVVVDPGVGVNVNPLLSNLRVPSSSSPIMGYSPQQQTGICYLDVVAEECLAEVPWSDLRQPLSELYLGHVEVARGGVGELVQLPLGYGGDERLNDAMEVVLKKQNSEGKWILEKTPAGRMQVDLEKRRGPSKWVTLKALRALKRIHKSKAYGIIREA